MGLDDLAAGIVKGLVHEGIAIIADQAKAKAAVLSELHKVLDPSIHGDSQDAFAKRLAELDAKKRDTDPPESPPMVLSDADVEDDGA